MPSNRELKRLQSQNRDLRAEVERLTNEADRLRVGLGDDVDRLQAALGTEEDLHNDTTKERNAALDRAACAEAANRVLQAEINDTEARLVAKYAAERGAIAAARESLALVLAEAREDIAAAEARLAELVERIEERGRRKEREQIGAIVNRAVLGCQRARREIEAAVERHLNRQGAAQPGMDFVLAAHNPTDAVRPSAAGLESMDLPLLALPKDPVVDDLPVPVAIPLVVDESRWYVEELPHKTMASEAERADQEGLEL